MTENKIKRRKPRHRIETFSLIKGGSTTFNTIPLPKNRSISDFSIGIQGEKRLIMSPYSEFIPLTYLSMTGDWKIPLPEGKLPKLEKGERRQIKASVTSRVYNNLRNENSIGVYSIIINKGFVGDTIYGNLRTLFANSLNYHRIHKENSGNWIICGPLGIYIIRGQVDGDWSEQELIPLIIPAVHKSNYIYQKMFMMKNKGSIDTSKACVFVNKDLEDPSFKPVGMRKEYINSFEGWLSEFGWNIWKVPGSFITENCFLPISIYPEKTGIFQMKEQKSKLLKEFYEGLRRRIHTEELSSIDVEEEGEGDNDDDEIIVGMEDQEDLGEEEPDPDQIVPFWA